MAVTAPRPATLFAPSVLIAALAGTAPAGQSAARSWTGSADEVRALIAETLADAETRSSLLTPGATSGYDAASNAFFLASDDGAWKLNISGFVQFRYVLNFRDDSGGEEDFESGFDNDRTKLIFDGTIAEKFIYYIHANFNRASGVLGLQDAFGGYNFEGGFYVKAGQFKLPFLREELVGDNFQLAAERSLTTHIFTQGRGVAAGRSQGVECGFRFEDWRCMLAFSDGFGSANSALSSNSPFSRVYGFTGGGGEADWAITGRGDFMFAGEWKQFKDFTSFPGSSYACMVGVAGHVEQSDQNLTAPGPDGALGTGDDLQGETTLGAWTVDLSVEGDGWNFFIAGNGQHVNNNLADIAAGTPADSSFDDYGLVVQGGVFIPNTDWEVFARYDASFADSDRTTTSAQDDVFNTITLGTNWYISGHAAKFTFDALWFLDDGMVLSGPNTLAGYFQDLTDEGEVTLRFQVQFYF